MRLKAIAKSIRPAFAAGFFFALQSSALAASATIYNPAPNPLYDTTGALAKGAKAYFYSAGTSTPLTVYQDAALTTPHTYPIVAGLNGVLPKVYLPYVDYRVRITTSSGSVIFDADNIENQAPASAGGGGSVATNKLFNTGFVIATPVGGALDGFVRMNGRTIGSASSSATERANNDCESLFKYLWNGVADSIAAVGGGRGVSADADWAANKTIVVPSMQGRTVAGVDDMGTSAANVLQVSTTANATNGNANITVASATGIARGMFVIIDGVASGTVSAISGTTVTLSASYSGTTGSNKATRLSFFSDAQLSSVSGGAQSAIMTAAELAQHNHGITDSGHTHPIPLVQFGGGIGGGNVVIGGNIGTAGTSNTSSATTSITINNTGQGLPSSVIQPTRLMHYYMKL